jgi:outer membrane biogenesis lipoprotein LolB
MLRQLCGCVLFGLFTIGGCRSPRVILSPIPPRVDSIEGYAQILLSEEEGVHRSKFSFVMRLYDRGRIEVSDFLGRSIYQIVIHGREAFLVIPPKGAYWKGETGEIIKNVLGFHLGLEEMVGFISGYWSSSGNSGWALGRDAQGRIQSGQRKNLRFWITDFVEDTRVPRSLRFESPSSSGRLKLLKLRFNPDFNPKVFSTAFVGKYRLMTWDQIREMLRDED